MLSFGECLPVGVGSLFVGGRLLRFRDDTDESMKTRLRNLQALSRFKSELCGTRSYELGGDCEEESLEERREIGRFQEGDT